MNSATKTVDNVLTYYETRLPYQLATALWSDSSPGYQKVWETRFSRGLVYAWSKMDLETRQRFVTLALDWAKTD